MTDDAYDSIQQSLQELIVYTLKGQMGWCTLEPGGLTVANGPSFFHGFCRIMPLWRITESHLNALIRRYILLGEYRLNLRQLAFQICNRHFQCLNGFR